MGESLYNIKSIHFHRLWCNGNVSMIQLETGSQVILASFFRPCGHRGKFFQTFLSYYTAGPERKE